MPELIWTKEKCAIEAAKHRTRTAFQKAPGGAYNRARAQGWLDEICAHMERPATAHHRVVYAIMSTVDPRCYVGLTFSPSRRLRDHKSYGTPAVKALLAAPHKVIVTQFCDKHVAAEAESRCVEMMRFLGREVLNSAKAGGLGGSAVRWSRRRLSAEAKKYQSLKEWRQKHPGSMEAARRQGVLYEVSAHMKPGRKKSGTWTREACADEAARFCRKIDFLRGCGSAYTIAYRNGWLDEICAHMRKAK